MKETKAIYNYARRIVNLIKDPDLFSYCFFCEEPLFDKKLIWQGYPVCKKCFNEYNNTELKN